MTREEWDERAAIMEFDGGLSRLEAERLARERPWDEDPAWGFPRAVQMKLPEPAYIRDAREKYCKP